MAFSQGIGFWGVCKKRAYGRAFALLLEGAVQVPLRSLAGREAVKCSPNQWEFELFYLTRRRTEARRGRSHRERISVLVQISYVLYALIAELSLRPSTNAYALLRWKFVSKSKGSIDKVFR